MFSTHTLAHADSKVLAFARDTGALICEYSYSQPLPNVATDFLALMANGLYNSMADVIGINVNPFPSRLGHDVNETILHELCHWAGHSSRLARTQILMTQDSANWDSITREGIHTEEATAQFGMFFLAETLGLDRSIYRTRLDYYLRVNPLADFAQAQREGHEAASYLIRLASENAFQSRQAA